MIGFKVFEDSEEDSPENIARRASQRESISPEVASFETYHEAPCPPISSKGYIVLDVLPELIGRPWNNAAANFLECLRPSAVRVTHGAITCDAHHWRVTVYLTPDNMIRKIEQETVVGLVGFRNGSDAMHYLKKDDDYLMKNQSNCIINTRAINKLTLGH
jgi:hypothetical protein